MRLHHVAKMPLLAMPIIGGFAVALLPILGLTFMAANQYKDDIVKTTYQRNDGSRYTETRGSCAPGIILLIGVAYFGESDRSFRFYPITFPSSFSSLPVLPYL